ncbi:hypothetical protein HGD80_01660 [Paulownia witches'-broom phytoplasma]|uniref:Uncharacterized protein n=1 Tax=Paulownia witches'-broom phytoplasma TaxID=39647 RepID=A0ABX8TPM4_9MOLU|nr:hypothetical protein [Paulownia witches'-broom phytoplasma]QYC31271.1 hypothetical protein HGD80_01660 [Paulownia witches'-broom phytoplasma]GLH60423.1 hypothetical protein PAWBP_1610 [Paulownia witches'-broom phytoplasma]
MNQKPRKVLIKKNNLPQTNTPKKPFLSSKLLSNCIIFNSIVIVVLAIYLSNPTQTDIYQKTTQLHLTAMVAGMFLGGTVLGLKKGSFGVSLGVLLGATLGMWLSLLTKGNIISIIQM